MLAGIRVRGVGRVVAVVLLAALVLAVPASAGGPAATLQPGAPPNAPSQAAEALFVSSFQGGLVWKLDLVANSATVIVSGLRFPEDGAVHPVTKQVYFTESCFGGCGPGVVGRINRFNADGSGFQNVLTSFSLRPEGLAFDAHGNLFFNTREGGDGRMHRIADGAPGSPPQAVTDVFTAFGEGSVVDRDGNLWGVDRAGARVLNFGTSLGPANAGTVVKAYPSVLRPIGLAEDRQGRIYVSDAEANRIVRFAPDGGGEEVFASGLRRPFFLEADGADNLYVTETEAGRVTRIAPDGTKNTVAILGDIVGLALHRAPQVRVRIDIKPGSFPNSIHLGSQGTVPVAVFGSPAFDVGSIDPATLRLAGAPVRVKPNGGHQASFEDVDADGFVDLVAHFVTGELQLFAGDTEAELLGETFDGLPFRGADSVRIVPPSWSSAKRAGGPIPIALPGKAPGAATAEGSMPPLPPVVGPPGLGARILPA